MSVKSENGFTLIELMIVVAIVGIISAIAYPSYQGMIASSARGAAQADLMAFASAMERHNASNFSYKGAATANGDTGAPTIFKAYSPASEPQVNKKYTLSIESVSNNGQSYLLKAVPVADSVSDGTGNMYIYSDGRKGWDSDANGTLDSDEYCWSC